MTVLASEAEELAGLATDGRAASADPALRRLLPDAYPDDPEASAEFRRFTAEGLAERKAQAARAMSQSLAHEPGRPAQVRLDEAEASAWLRTITGIRLVLASRLGIEHDEDTGQTPRSRSCSSSSTTGWRPCRTRS